MATSITTSLRRVFVANIPVKNAQIPQLAPPAMPWSSDKPTQPPAYVNVWLVSTTMVRVSSVLGVQPTVWPVWTVWLVEVVTRPTITGICSLVRVSVRLAIMTILCRHVLHAATPVRHALRLPHVRVVTWINIDSWQHCATAKWASTTMAPINCVVPA